MAVIIFKPEVLNPHRRGGIYLGGVLVTRGRNKLTETQLEKAKSIPEFELYQDKGAIIFIDESGSTQSDEDEILNLYDYSVREAEKIIAEELDVKLLEKWRDSEATTKERTTILNAIAKQIKAIENGDI